MSHACHHFWTCYKTFTSCSLLARCRTPCACHATTSEPSKVVFSLPSVLRATTASTFSSLIWPGGSTPAALASLLFDPPEPVEKHSLSDLFARLHLLSSDSFSSLIFSLLLFSSLTLPTSAFPSVHIVGSLTSKLPAIVYIFTHYKLESYRGYSRIYDIYIFMIIWKISLSLSFSRALYTL